MRQIFSIKTSIFVLESKNAKGYYYYEKIYKHTDRNPGAVCVCVVRIRRQMGSGKRWQMVV